MTNKLEYDFALTLRHLRKKEHLTQEKLSQDLNVSRSTVAMWETNKNQPTGEQMLALSKKFNVSIDYLFGKEQENLAMFTERVRVLMNEMNLDVKSLSEKSNVHYEIVAAIHDGTCLSLPEPEDMYALARALETNPEYLATGDRRYRNRYNEDSKSMYYQIVDDLTKENVTYKDIKLAIEIIKTMKKEQDK